MMTPETADPRRDWARFWASASGFWRGAPAWRVWLLCGLLLCVVALQLYVQFRLNYWNRDFFDALERRDPGRLQHQALLLLPLCGASIVLAVTSVWGRMTTQRMWRKWLTNHLIQYWTADERYIRLAQVQSEQQIPEYRVAEDARIATDAPIDLALGVVSSLLTAYIFIQVLWDVGADITFSVYGLGVWLPGYLVIGVVVYSGMITGAMVLVGSPLTQVIQTKNQREAELITAAHMLRDIGEGHEPKEDEPQVKATIQQAVRNVLEQWRRLCWRLMRMTLVSQGNTLIAPIMGLILCAPKFLTGAMTLGEMTQAAAAFTLVQTSFNYLVDNYGRVADWISSVERVGRLLLSLDRLDPHSPKAEVKQVGFGVGSLKPLP